MLRWANFHFFPPGKAGPDVRKPSRTLALCRPLAAVAQRPGARARGAVSRFSTATAARFNAEARPALRARRLREPRDLWSHNGDRIALREHRASTGACAIDRPAK